MDIMLSLYTMCWVSERERENKRGHRMDNLVIPFAFCLLSISKKMRSLYQEIPSRRLVLSHWNYPLDEHDWSFPPRWYYLISHEVPATKTPGSRGDASGRVTQIGQCLREWARERGEGGDRKTETDKQRQMQRPRQTQKEEETDRDGKRKDGKRAHKNIAKQQNIHPRDEYRV